MRNVQTHVVAEGAIASQVDVVLFGKVKQFLILETHMHLDLVDFRSLTSTVNQSLEVLGGVVGNTNGATAMRQIGCL